MTCRGCCGEGVVPREGARADEAVEEEDDTVASFLSELSRTGEVHVMVKMF